MTNLLKFVNKMCKYEMDPANIVQDTDRTGFSPQMDGQTDKVKPVYASFNFIEAGCITTQRHIQNTFSCWIIFF